MSNQKFTFLIIALVVGFCLVLIAIDNKMFPWQWNRQVAEHPQDKKEKDAKNVMVADQPEKPPQPGMVKIGGIWRPKGDVENLLNPGTSEPTTSKQPSLPIGQTPFVKPDANKQVASVAKAIREKKNPERLSVFRRGKKFDSEEFKANPAEYLITIEPGRVFQPADPGPGVKPIRRRGTGFVKVIQGETAMLQVKAEPNAPVSFHSSQLGQFSSGLNSITVQANEEGIAEAQFTASGGTYQDVEILAASPMNSGQVDFLVYVELPKPIPKIDK